MLTVKKWIVRAVCHRAIAGLIHRFYRDQIPSRGFAIDPGGEHISWTAIPRLFWGLYERAEIDLIAKHLRADLDVVELGASLGVVSLHIARHQNDDRRLVCVEANPQLIPIIRRNVQRNVPQKQIEIVHAAICDGSTPEVEFALASDPLESTIAQTSGRTKKQPAGSLPREQSTCRVNAVRLSDLLVQHSLHDFALVCDIEGAEVAILRDDPQSLSNCHQIFLELHPSRYADWQWDTASLCERLEQLGFAREAGRGAVGYWRRVTPPPTLLD